MCKYCERRTDVKFGWEQPKLPYHNNMPFGMNLAGNALDNEKWEGDILDYQTTTPILRLTCEGYFSGEGVGTIQIPIKYCPECGRKLGKVDTITPLPTNLIEEKAKAFDRVAALYENVSIFDEDGVDSKIFASNICDILCEIEDLSKQNQY